MEFLDRISAAIYPVVILGMVVGFGWAGLDWLNRQSAIATAQVPHEVAFGCAAAAIIGASWLLERMVPLRAMPQLRWVYHERPRGRMRSVDSWTVYELIAVVAGGALLGAAVGHPELALLGIATQLIFAFAKPATLPNLLAAGRTRLVGTGSLAVQDSELVADALAASWVSWRTPSIRPLVLRRLLRRNYLIIVAVLVALAAIALVNPLGSAVMVPLSIAWTVLGAAVYRCAETSRISPSHAWVFPIVLHSLLGAVLIWGLCRISPMALAALATALGFGAYRRGRPRRVTTLTFADSGFGISTSPELIGYYLKGLSWVVGISMIVFAGCL
ncbi:hypothetical protein QVA66_10700 [Staphylococcus chromogenes]|nr:hypothetical protein [Staphylococcus chromogenes]